MCYSYTRDTPFGGSKDDCELFIQSTVAAQQTEFFRLSVVAEDASPREARLVDETTISNAQGMSLTYKGQDEKDRALFSFTQSSNDVP